MMNLRSLGYFFSLFCAFAWALSGILYKQVSGSFSPVTITACKVLVSVFFLGIILLAGPHTPVAGKPLYYLAASGVLGITFGDTFFFFSLKKLSALLALVVTMLIPVITIILSSWILHERFSVFSYLGIIVTVSGVGLVSAKELCFSESSATTLIGIVLGLASALSCSLSIILAKSALASVPALEATFVRQVAGLVVIAFIMPIAGKVTSWRMDPFTRKPLAGVKLLSAAFIGAFLGTWFCLIGLKLAPATTATVLNSTSPLFMLPLAYVFLHKRISATEIFGSLIAFSGIAMIVTGDACAR